MLKRIAIVAIALTAVGSARPAHAQQTPEEFAVAYMDATRAADWSRVASFMHPDALKQFKEMFAAIATIDTTGQVLTNLFGVSSAAEFAAASPDSIYTGFMTAMIALSPDLGAALSGSTMQTIGHVEEQATGLTYVVFRMQVPAEGITVSQVDVVPLKKHGGDWKAMLTGDVEGMAAAIKQRLGGGL